MVLLDSAKRQTHEPTVGVWGTIVQEHRRPAGWHQVLLLRDVSSQLSCSSPRVIPGAVLSPGNSSVLGKKTSLGQVQESCWRRSLVPHRRQSLCNKSIDKSFQGPHRSPCTQGICGWFSKAFSKEGCDSSLSGPAPPSTPPWLIRTMVDTWPKASHSASWPTTSQIHSPTQNLINPTSHHTHTKINSRRTEDLLWKAK